MSLRVSEDPMRALLESSARGDEGAFAALFDRTVCGSLAIARCAAEDEDAAQRATHDAFLEIWHRARTGRVPDGDLMTWVLGVVRRHALGARVAA